MFYVKGFSSLWELSNKKIAIEEKLEGIKKDLEIYSSWLETYLGEIHFIKDDYFQQEYEEDDIIQLKNLVEKILNKTNHCIGENRT